MCTNTIVFIKYNGLFESVDMEELTIDRIRELKQPLYDKFKITAMAKVWDRYSSSTHVLLMHKRSLALSGSQFQRSMIL
jgi:hypothetical protein